MLYRGFIKRLLDIIISFTALLCLSPFLLLVSLLLYVTNKRAGVFFLQERPGKDGKIFRVVKFKTMTDARDADGNLLPDEKRLTPVGRFVRSASIDELLQFVNVLKGDMSLIGPRPLLVRYLPLYSPSRPAVTKCALVYRAGRSATAATHSHGVRSSPTMCGTSTMSRS